MAPLPVSVAFMILGITLDGATYKTVRSLPLFIVLKRIFFYLLFFKKRICTLALVKKKEHFNYFVSMHYVLLLCSLPLTT